MRGSTMRAKHLRATAGKLVMALAFAAMVGGLSTAPALAKSGDIQVAQRHDDRHFRRDDHHFRHDHPYYGGYQPYGYYAPPPVYGPPPPPSPGIGLFFPGVGIGVNVR
jgi:hypothetical protein